MIFIYEKTKTDICYQPNRLTAADRILQLLEVKKKTDLNMSRKRPICSYCYHVIIFMIKKAMMGLHIIFWVENRYL